MINHAEGRFVDLQVNGYMGIDFNQDDLTAEDLHLACGALRRDGVSAALATIITDRMEVMCQRLRRLVELRQADSLVKDVIAGVHIEGPFINRADGYRGAHPEDAVVTADVDHMQKLLDAAAGTTRLVTLAPECDPGMKTTRLLARQGITVAAGHCNPSLEQLDRAIDAGLTMFTHLGNGCPMSADRHDNIVQRVLSRSDKLWVSFIGDGVHVPYFALKNYLKVVGPRRCVLVSDAMAGAGLGPGNHTIGRWQVEIGDDLSAWAPGKAHLLGSAMGLSKAAEKLKRELNLSDRDIATIAYANPIKAVRLPTTKPNPARTLVR